MPRPSVPDGLVRLFRSNRAATARLLVEAEDIGTKNRALRERALLERQSSRPSSHFAHLTGAVSGAALTALVRQDGSAVGDRRWLRISALPSAPATGDVWPDPLRTTLSLSRSCDRLLSLRFVDVGRPNAPLAAGCTAMYDGPGAPFSMEVAEDGDVHLVRLVGEIDMAVALALGARLTEIAGSTVDVDLSQVTFLDARGLTALLTARHRVTDAGHAFRLRGARGITRRVFELTGLEEVLDD